MRATWTTNKNKIKAQKIKTLSILLNLHQAVLQTQKIKKRKKGRSCKNIKRKAARLFQAVIDRRTKKKNLKLNKLK
jgi:hypothetical protein